VFFSSCGETAERFYELELEKKKTLHSVLILELVDGVFLARRLLKLHLMKHM